jgi:hypothetical protein
MEYVVTRKRRETKKYPYGALGYKALFEKMTKLPGKVKGVPTDFQLINISLSPILVAHDSAFSVSHCDPCTDTVLYKDQFVPMCLLEYVKTMNYGTEGTFAVLDRSGSKVTIRAY